jgi:hypothetical protein
MTKETINIKTTNGTAVIVRKDKAATITEERTCYGFKEKTVTQVTKLSADCMHFAFSVKQDIIDQLKNK